MISFLSLNRFVRGPVPSRARAGQVADQLGPHVIEGRCPRRGGWRRVGPFELTGPHGGGTREACG